MLFECTSGGWGDGGNEVVDGCYVPVEWARLETQRKVSR